MRTILWILAALTSLTFCDRVAAFGTMVALRPGHLVTIDCKKPAKLPPNAGDDFVAIGCGKDLFLALRYDGSLIAWGVDRYGAIRNQPQGNNFIGIACGMDHCLAMRSDGTLVVWGGCEKQADEVIVTPPGHDFLDLTAGGGFSAVIKNDGDVPGQGSLFSWGWVKDPPAGKNFVAVKGGNKHFIALRADGTAVGWGSNNFKQTSSIVGSNGLAMIAGAGYRNLGLKSDGTVQLYHKDEATKGTPAGFEKIVALTGGYGSYDIGIKSDGSLVQRPIAQCPPPKPISGNRFVAVASGYYASLAIEAPESPKTLTPTVHAFAAPGHELVVHRAMDVGPALKVHFELDGVKSSTEIPAGACAAVVPAKAGQTLKLLASDGYAVGAPASATASIGGKSHPASFWARKIGPIAGPFAQELKAIRSTKSLSQSQLADALKVSVSTLQQWEAGWTVPEGSTAILAKANTESKR